MGLVPPTFLKDSLGPRGQEQQHWLREEELGSPVMKGKWRSSDAGWTRGQDTGTRDTVERGFRETDTGHELQDMLVPAEKRFGCPSDCPQQKLPAPSNLPLYIAPHLGPLALKPGCFPVV